MNEKPLLAKVGEREIHLSRLDKVFWPSDGFTKGQLIDYYAKVSPWLLPHLKDRPLSLVRFPEGIGEKGFYQKDAPPGTPPWVRIVPVKSKEKGGYINFVLCDNVETLVWLANLGVIEINPWLSHYPTLSTPDFAVFDIDPSEGTGWDDVIQVALMVKSLLDLWNLKGFPKISGKDGIHVFVPLEAKYTYKEVATFVEYGARIIHGAYPDKITLERQVSKRTGHVYIDFPQNARGQTISAVYGVRALPSAPCSMPFSWRELPELKKRQFNIENAIERVSSTGDLFLGALMEKQNIDGILRKASLGKHNYATAMRRQHNLGKTNQKTSFEP